MARCNDRNLIERPPLWWCIFASIGMPAMSVIAIASWTVTVSPSSSWAWFTGWWSRHVLMAIFVIAWGLHVIEAAKLTTMPTLAL